MTHASGMRARDIAVSSLAAAGSAGAGAGGIYASGQSSTTGGKYGDVGTLDSSPQELPSQLHIIDKQNGPQKLSALSDETNSGGTPKRTLTKGPTSKSLTSACMSVDLAYGITNNSEWIQPKIRLMGQLGNNEAITVFTIVSNTDSGGLMMGNSPGQIRHQIDYGKKSDNSSGTRVEGFTFSDALLSHEITVFSSFKLTPDQEIKTKDNNGPTDKKEIKGIGYLIDEGGSTTGSNPVSIKDPSGSEYTFLDKNGGEVDKDKITPSITSIVPSGKLLTIPSGKIGKWEPENNIGESLKHCSLK